MVVGYGWCEEGGGLRVMGAGDGLRVMGAGGVL